MTRLVLASTSPARLKLLRQAGIEPITIAPLIDEDALANQLTALGQIGSTADLVLALAKAKAQAVAALPQAAEALVIGCDSSLEFAGQSLGKPHLPEVAAARWRAMRGKTAVLHTGHWLVDTRANSPLAPAGAGLSPDTSPPPPAGTGRVTSTTVTFANLSDAEIEAYVATGEPLAVAGAFTLDARGGAFITEISGDAHSVVGLSLATLRDLVSDRGVHYPDLWHSAHPTHSTNPAHPTHPTHSTHSAHAAPQ